MSHYDELNEGKQEHEGYFVEPGGESVILEPHPRNKKSFDEKGRKKVMSLLYKLTRFLFILCTSREVFCLLISLFSTVKSEERQANAHQVSFQENLSIKSGFAFYSPLSLFDAFE
jgi:hypothetical protein